jgi:hypothetical protein
MLSQVQNTIDDVSYRNYLVSIWRPVILKSVKPFFPKRLLNNN